MQQKKNLDFIIALFIITRCYDLVEHKLWQIMSPAGSNQCVLIPWAHIWLRGHPALCMMMNSGPHPGHGYKWIHCRWVLQDREQFKSILGEGRWGCWLLIGWLVKLPVLWFQTIRGSELRILGEQFPPFHHDMRKLLECCGRGDWHPALGSVLLPCVHGGSSGRASLSPAAVGYNFVSYSNLSCLVAVECAVHSASWAAKVAEKLKAFA